MKLFLRLLIIFTFIISLNVQADQVMGFTPTQTADIENIVRNYLISHPEVLVDAAHALQQKQQINMQQQAQQAIVKNSKQLFASDTSPVVGDSNGEITLIEFFDYQCPYCKQMAPMLVTLNKKYPHLRLVFKQLPIFGDASEYAARAALAASKQNKFFALHNALMKTPTPFTNTVVMNTAKSVGLDTKQLQADINDAAIAQELKTNETLANDLGLMGTPAFVIAKVKIVDPQSVSDVIFLPGATDLKTLESVIKQTQQGQ